MFSETSSNEPLSSLTHFIATLLSIAGLSLLVTFAALRGGAIHVVATSVFGSSLLLLYLFSALYHFISREHPAKDLFRILDHSMVYILIAGTYTPIVLLLLPAGWGWSMFGVIWGLALLGIINKSFKLPLPKWASVVFYLVMGWIIVVAFIPLKSAITAQGLVWLVGGGLFYTIGTIFFALDNVIKLNRWYTLHDVFHIFVMFGSFSHFWFILEFVLPS